MREIIFKSALILSLMSTSLFAEDDYSIGKKLYQKSCNSCHGQVALKMNTPMLHGQEGGYLNNALKKFKSNERTDNILFIMNSIAATLTEKQMEQVSLYLTAQDSCDIKMVIDTERPGFMEEFKAGRTTVAEKNCMHCHGSFHHGAPKLFGQKVQYIKTSLDAFKDSTRTGFAMMNRISAKLTTEEIHNISVYLNAMKLMRECN